MATLRDADWLTPDRLDRVSRTMLVLTGLAIAVWLVLADDMIDLNGKPIGTDFSNVWAAGQLVLDGTPEAAYDPVRHYAAQREAFGGRDVPFYGWHYPPLFLGVAAVLGLLPYGLALLAWMAATLPLYIAAVRAIVARPEAVWLALAFPAVFINLGHGQNGFLTAGLLGLALAILDRRPVVAGILIGLMAYKPQFGLLIPLVLVVSRRWTCIAAAAATVLAACGLSLALFGPESWLAFWDSLGFTRGVVLEAGGTGWQKIQSLFSAARMWGGSVELAYAAQTGLSIIVAASLVWLWRSNAAHALKAAALATGALLATPYVLDYDMVVLAVSITFFAAHGLEHGFRPYEKSALAAAWIAPLVARSLAGATMMPLGLLVMIALYALILWRAVQDQAAPEIRRSPSLAQA